ncbi:MAG TPA: glycosyltransferase family 4 protein [Bacteroidia bacterium]|jgi:glycosyltransferase involved in cell wall biosynthesis|nr:glycosyltransferase family 4 protein [Bacteroidia bacterium]
MKILQVCSKIPYPSKDGGSIAMNILTEGLIACGNQVTVLAMSTPKSFMKPEEINQDYQKKTAFQTVFIDTAIKPMAAVLNLFSRKSYNIQRFYSKEFENALETLLTKENFDIIQLETLWVTPYVEAIRKKTKAKIVYRSHNVEYIIWERLATIASNPLKKLYLQLLAGRLKKYEVNMLNKYDAIASITELDIQVYKKLGCSVPTIHTPFGISLSNYEPQQTAIEFPSLFHIGAMDWMPNQEGIKWFLKGIWPAIHAQFPDLNLYLAGKNMPAWLLELKMDNVIVVGEVADTIKFINPKSVMIVPLQSGGGMRVKIIEGMALAKTVITTPIGAEGIECRDKENILLATTETEFIECIAQCVTSKPMTETIGRNARKLIENKYDNHKICKLLAEFYQTLN